MESAEVFIERVIDPGRYAIGDKAIKAINDFFLSEVTSRDLAIRQDESARCAEKAVHALNEFENDWIIIDGAVHSKHEDALRLAITQGQPDPRDALLKEARDALAKAHDHLEELIAKLPMQYFGLVDGGIIQNTDNPIDCIDQAALGATK